MIIQFENCVNYFRKLILNELSQICICWVAGGCVRDYFSIGKMSSDIDIYFPSEEDYKKAIEYLCKSNTRVMVSEDIDENNAKVITKIITSKETAKIVFENDNVTKVLYNGMKFDIIKKYFPSVKDTILEFDFTVCCAGVDLHNVYTHDTFFIDLSKRQLMINKLPYPLSTMWRMQKYINKGYYMCSGEMLKLSKAIGELQTNTAEGEQAAIDMSPLSEGGNVRFTTFD